MTIGHVPTKEITRNRKRPKKTSTNSTITREVFNGQHRKELEIPTFIDYYIYIVLYSDAVPSRGLCIDYYNHYMNLVDVAN